MTDNLLKQHKLTIGGPVCVYEAGEENLSPVLLLHGAMYDESRIIWHNLLPSLCEKRRVFAIDFPRHGQSRPWDTDVTQECLVAVVKGVIDHFNLAPLPIIGLSMGGAIAIAYALQYPEQVTSAVLMGPGGLGEKVSYQFISWLVTRIPGVLTYFSKVYSELSIEDMKKKLASLLEAGENTKDFEKLAVIMSEEAKLKWKFREKAMDDWQIQNLSPFKLKVNFLPELYRLSCPTLWIRGENDTLVSRKVMEEAIRFAPDSKLEIIKNAGHLLPLEQPDKVSRLIFEFLHIT